VYFGVEEKIRGMKDLNATYELSQPYSIPKRLPVHIPYRHLVTLVQIGETWDAIKAILLRTQQLPEDLSLEDEQRLLQRVDHALYWLSTFAPESLRFTVQQKLPKLHLIKEQQTFLSTLLKLLPSLPWDPEAIHKAIYDATEEVNISIKTSFKTIYQLFLGKQKGPRVGYFLSMLDREFVLKRCKEALK
jgi:lysyl-tRNA synthetase class 1